MLEFLRNGVQTWYFKGLLLLLVASFAIWGVGDFTSGGSTGAAVATVGNKDISGPSLVNAFNRQMRQLRGAITPEQARELGVLDQVLSALIDESLYDAEADNMGVTVSDAAVVGRIHQERAFRGELTKTFDRTVFERVLSQNGLGEQEYVNGIRRDAAREQMMGGFNAAAAPKSMVERLYKWRHESRIAEVLNIPVNISLSVGAPDEVALAAIHKSREAEFTAPEYRKATVLLLRAEDLTDEVIVSDEDLKTAYEQRTDEFSVSERRTVLQMVLADAETAKKALSLLAEGQSFEDVAKSVAEQDKDSIELGAVTKDDLPGDLADAVFKLNNGETSGPLKGPFGTHVFRVTDVLTGTVKSFDEVRDILKQTIAADRAIDALYKLSNELDDSLGGGASLAEAAQALNIKLLRFDAIDSQGRAPGATQATSVAGLPAGPGFLQTLFETLQGEDSALIESGENAFFVLRVDAITPSAVLPLDAVREKVVAAWRADERKKRAFDIAEGVLGAVAEGKTLTTLALPYGFPVTTTKAFKRNGANAGSDISAGLVSDMFNLQTGEAAMGETGTGYAVAILKEIKAPQNVKAEVDATKSAVLRGLSSDIIVQFNKALRDRHLVEVNQLVVNRLFNAYP
ncbi:MAG: SurA N-terminal domain-containing protein [Alphaproteobacteria bacterium]|nr:SurA N-terminal domain-containing protein [Alphaproteobacteria bacterium]